LDLVMSINIERFHMIPTLGFVIRV